MDSHVISSEISFILRWLRRDSIFLEEFMSGVYDKFLFYRSVEFQ